MTRRLRPRTPIVCTGADVAVLERLVKAAGAMARGPLADPGPLMRAADRAAKAVLPAAQRRRGSDLVRLIRLAQGWGRLGAAVRAASAPALAALAEAAGPSLAPDPTGPVRPRADIDG